MTVLRLAASSLLSLGFLCGQPLDTLLVLETSPGTEHATGLIRPSAFAEDDRVGVVGFGRAAQLLQPLTQDRDALAEALQQAGARAGAAMGGVQLNTNLRVDLVGALGIACDEIGRRGSTERGQAIVIVFGSEDPNLGVHLDALKVALSAANARLYAIAVQRIDPQATPLNPRGGIACPFPSMTAQLLSELVLESGGRIFKRNWDLKKILAQARKP